MTIKYSVTYEIVTPDSAEYGDYDEQGWVYPPGDPCEADFREMVDLMMGLNPSSSEPSGNTYDWYTEADGEIDYGTGAETRQSYHPLTSRDARYMLKAWKLAQANWKNRRPS